MTRFHFARLANLKYFQAKFSYPSSLHKPLVWATVIQGVVCYVPIVAGDIVGMSTLRWGNQLYITMIETFVLSILMCILQIIELLRIKKHIGDFFNTVKNDSTAIASMATLDPEAKAQVVREIEQKAARPKGIFIEKDILALRLKLGTRGCESAPLSPKEKWGEDSREIHSEASIFTFGKQEG